MRIDTARVRIGNAIHRAVRGLDDRSEWDRKLWNVLRGIWLTNGVDAVNDFVVNTGDMATLMVGIPGEYYDIPPVRRNFTDADFQGKERR